MVGILSDEFLSLTLRELYERFESFAAIETHRARAGAENSWWTARFNLAGKSKEGLKGFDSYWNVEGSAAGTEEGRDETMAMRDRMTTRKERGK